MTNILLPIDFSPAARQAYQYALGLAPYLGARITLLHVMPATELVAVTASAGPAQAVSPARSQVDAAFAEWLSLPLSDSVSVDTRVAQGQAAQEILRESRELAADLIIMGSQGLNRTRYRLFGRETAQVMQQAHCPVMVIPEEVPFRPFTHLSYASGAALCGEGSESVQSLLRLAEAFQAKVSCASILPRPNQWYRMEFRYLEARFRRKLKSHLLGVYHFPEENLVQGMHKFMHETQVDLLALRTEHETLFNWLFAGSIPRRLAAYTRVPLLIFRE